MKRVLGLDIGGANLKAAHANGSACLRPFPLWKHPDQLVPALAQLVRGLPPFDTLAVTMTGELCDCFESKRAGVETILTAAAAVAGQAPVRVWLTSGRLADLAQARARPLEVAAANWLALATYAGRFASDGPGLLLDIGSTTTDIIPLAAGRPVPRGRTDVERLQTRELVYVGVRRTPVCALVHGTVAAELFATTLDVHLILGHLPEDGGTDTADGRPATRPLAYARLARMLCGDGETLPRERVEALAAEVCRAEKSLLLEGLASVARTLDGPSPAVVLAGSGEFLGRLLLEARGLAGRVVSVAERLGPALSAAACAYAVAVLAAEGNHD
jgi:probable H4MPT-linked C1 transfer pathway protein